MISAVLVLSFFFTYSSLGVSAFNLVSFSSIEQCGSFNITFNGGQAPVALPLKLTVVPFNSTNPITIPISDNDWNATTSTGAAVTFLPFAAGTSFVASLDDADSQSTGSVSNIITIQPSDDSSCLTPTNASLSTPTFQVIGELSQCESFSIAYPTTPPSVRVFRPLGPSFFLNNTGENDDGEVTFLMEVRRGFEMAMLFEDGNGNMQTTNMETVTGTSTSSSSCIPNSTLIINQSTHTPSQNSKGLSKGSIIGIVVGVVGTVLVVAIIMGAYVFIQRRERAVVMANFTNLSSEVGGRGAEKGKISQPSMQQTSDITPPLPVFPSFLSTKQTRIPLGVLPPATTPMSPEFISYNDRGTEWTQQTQPTRRPSSSNVAVKSPLRTQSGSQSSRRRPSMLSEGDMDIEQILDMARLYTQPNSPEYSVDLTRQSTPDSVRTWNRSRANSMNPSTPRLPTISDEAQMPVSQWAGNQTARRLGGRSGSLKYTTPGAQVQKIEAPLPETPLPSAVGETNRI